MRTAGWPMAGLVFLGMTLALSACGGSGGGGRPDRPLPGIRYVPVSPLGEPLGPPGADPAPYREAMRAWFVRTDKNGDGRLSPAEMQAEADRVFPLFDLNGDGHITSAELTSYRVSTPFHALPADTGRRLRPGRIDMTPDEAASLTREGKGRPQYRMGIDPVMAADTNADFRVTREELRAEAARRLAAMDKNAEGSVTLAAFMEHAEGPMRAWTAQ